MYEQRIIQWDGRDIRLSYAPLKWQIINHLEIQSIDGDPLPVTSTGYLSHHFAPSDPNMSMDEIVAMVIEWLDGKSQEPAWQDYVTRTRQLSLF